MASYLQQGSSGSGVKQLQIDLFTLGFEVGAIDGVFGSQTKRAVLDFQYTYGVTVDGIVGMETATAIKEALDLFYQGNWDSSNDPLKYEGTTPTVGTPNVPAEYDWANAPTQQWILDWVSQWKGTGTGTGTDTGSGTGISVLDSILPKMPAGFSWKWVGIGLVGVVAIVSMMGQDRKSKKIRRG